MNNLVDTSNQTGNSNWLTILPTTEFKFKLSKQQFSDSIRLRYDLQNLNSMSCKKDGFISIRHNGLRDLAANMMSEVCKDMKIEPKLKPLSGEGL